MTTLFKIYGSQRFGWLPDNGGCCVKNRKTGYVYDLSDASGQQGY